MLSRAASVEDAGCPRLARRSFPVGDRRRGGGWRGWSGRLARKVLDRQDKRMIREWEKREREREREIPFHK